MSFNFRAKVSFNFPAEPPKYQLIFPPKSSAEDLEGTAQLLAIDRGNKLGENLVMILQNNYKLHFILFLNFAKDYFWTTYVMAKLSIMHDMTRVYLLFALENFIYSLLFTQKCFPNNDIFCQTIPF
jgi:hypothetical protein